MRFIATADWQLGMSAHFLDDEARPRFHQARFDVVRRVGELAVEVGAECVVVAGDVFESNQLNRTVVARAVEALNTFQVPVVLLPGNHDPLDAASIYDAPAFTSRVGDHVHVIRSSGVYQVSPRVEIVGAPWFSKRPLNDLVAQACEDLPVVEQGTFRIVLGHGAASTIDPDPNNPASIDVSALSEVLEQGKAHVAVLGDRHGTLEVDTGIWYPGAPEVTHRREIDPGNVWEIDVTTTPASVTKHRVGTWVFTTIEEYLTNADDVEALIHRLMEFPHKERTAVWLALRGTLSTKQRARLDHLIEEYRDVFARIDFWDRHTDLVTVAESDDFNDLGLTGFALHAFEELAQKAKDDDSAHTAQDALGLLYRLAAKEQQ